MKIGVVTIYNSLNSGSYLQALALCEFLRSAGYEVGLVRNKINSKNRCMYRILLFFKYMLKGRFRQAYRIILTYTEFVKARMKYRYIKQSAADVCIYGSDTIWNIAEPYFGKEWKHYFGANYVGKKVAYAPSLGPTSGSVFLKHKELQQCLAAFSAIGVRDAHTLEAIRQVLPDRDIACVVDPTMLLEPSFYAKIARPCSEDNFVLFYAFSRMDSAMLEIVHAFARERNLKLICLGDNIDFCDKYVVRNPFSMMGYFSKASYVITDTFHGSVFSILFRKNFICMDRGKTKVNDLLEQFGLITRVAKTAEDMNSLLRTKIEFGAVEQTLEQMRGQSQVFLLGMLQQHGEAE